MTESRGNGADQKLDLLEFPTRYEIKAMGRDSPRFEAITHNIVSRHVQAADLLGIQRRPSSKGKYISITFIVKLHSRRQLEQIYQDLHDAPEVLAAL